MGSHHRLGFTPDPARVRGCLPRYRTSICEPWASSPFTAQRLSLAHSPAPEGETPTGRMIWFTSGQHFGPMDNELDYAVSKGALHQMTTSIDHALSTKRIVANCINPGPVDTGYAHGEAHEHVASMFPDGRWARRTMWQILSRFFRATRAPGSAVRCSIPGGGGGGIQPFRLTVTRLRRAPTLARSPGVMPASARR